MADVVVFRDTILGQENGGLHRQAKKHGRSEEALPASQTKRRALASITNQQLSATETQTTTAKPCISTVVRKQEPYSIVSDTACSQILWQNDISCSCFSSHTHSQSTYTQFQDNLEHLFLPPSSFLCPSEDVGPVGNAVNPGTCSNIATTSFSLSSSFVSPTTCE